MPTSPHLPQRLAACVGVCAALVILASSCASDAAVGGGGPHFTGDRAATLEPASVTTSPSTSAPPSDPAVPEAPAEDPVTTSTVDVAEVNQVADWLANIVREEALPQKLLVVHQFRISMITNREQIETPPELAVLIHMDGQGSLTAKYNTWNALTGLADADRFYWGWKNFYDEDSPMAAPEQVLELSPKIVFVSFQ